MTVKELKEVLNKFDDNLIVVAKDTEDEFREVEDNGMDLFNRVQWFLTSDGVNVCQECLLIEP